MNKSLDKYNFKSEDIELQQYYISLVSSLNEEAKEIIARYYSDFHKMLSYTIEGSFPNFSVYTDSQIVINELEDVCAELGAFYTEKNVIDVDLTSENTQSNDNHFVDIPEPVQKVRNNNPESTNAIPAITTLDKNKTDKVKSTSINKDDKKDQQYIAKQDIYYLSYKELLHSFACEIYPKQKNLQEIFEFRFKYFDSIKIWLRGENDINSFSKSFCNGLSINESKRIFDILLAWVNYNFDSLLDSNSEIMSSTLIKTYKGDFLNLSHKAQKVLIHSCTDTDILDKIALKEIQVNDLLLICDHKEFCEISNLFSTDNTNETSKKATIWRSTKATDKKDFHKIENNKLVATKQEKTPTNKEKIVPAIEKERENPNIDDKKGNDNTINYLKLFKEENTNNLYDYHIINILNSHLPYAFKGDKKACNEIINNFGEIKKLRQLLCGLLTPDKFFGNGIKYISNAFNLYENIRRGLEKYILARTKEFHNTMKGIASNQFDTKKLNEIEKEIIYYSCPNKWVEIKVRCGCAKLDELLFCCTKEQYDIIKNAYRYRQHGFEYYLLLLLQEAHNEEKSIQKEEYESTSDDNYIQPEIDLHLDKASINVFKKTTLGYDADHQLMRVNYSNGVSKTYYFPDSWFDIN